MSTLFVDTINEKTSGNGVAIPGHVVQVVQNTMDTNLNTVSTSFVDTGASVSITPKFNNSKVFFIHSGNFNTQYATTWTDLTLYRDIGGTLTHLGNTHGFNGIYADSDTHGPSSINYLDSPATTSQVIYRIYIKCRTASKGGRYNPDGHRTTLIVMEIAQ